MLGSFKVEVHNGFYSDFFASFVTKTSSSALIVLTT